MEETVVFEAPPAEECVEGVQRLLPLHRLRKRSIQAGSAERGQLHWVGGLQEVLVPVDRAALAVVCHFFVFACLFECVKRCFFLREALSDADATTPLTQRER